MTMGFPANSAGKLPIPAGLVSIPPAIAAFNRVGWDPLFPSPALTGNLCCIPPRQSGVKYAVVCRITCSKVFTEAPCLAEAQSAIASPLGHKSAFFLHCNYTVALACNGDAG
ncbi:hypothetical protein [Phormidium sp. CCY1219]|uniref:hypothetical protein n=1 Tax=Phormidium sp. CCY1219 TaxID=2886104 RepID=UPI002D1F502B|nr:hypothetical protein [Phormidium sp. CCY1219]MEB3831648.1 hypothetical protein [Phormidium sp. CCY1219]